MKRTEVLFLDNYYKYKSFIEQCRVKVYDSTLVLHIHHILPKCFKVEIADRFNTVKLSVEDHIEAHLLLAECFTEGSYERLSNIRAAKLLSKNSIRELDVLNELYKFSKGEGNPFYGKVHSEETKQRLRESTIKSRGGVKYEDFYGSKAEEEKQKRGQGVKRVWDNRTENERSLIIEKIKQTKANTDTTGSNNANAKTIYVDGLKYGSIEEAKKALGKSRYRLLKEHKIT